MRCWIGCELEHNNNYGSRTLFVESANLNVADLIPIITKYDINSIYLGAGEIDLIHISNDELLKNYYVTLETSTENINPNLCSIADNIVIRVNLTEFNKIDNISLKYRLIDKVGLMNCADFKETNISKVRNGMYPEDTIVYLD